MYACICKNHHHHDNGTDENISELPLQLFDSTRFINNITMAINPQDIILNSNDSNSYYRRNHYFENTSPDPSGYFMKTEQQQQPLYLNFNDNIINDTLDDLMFSIPCPEESFSSSSSICSLPTRRSSSTDDTPEQQNQPEPFLPPSAAILQSELDKSSLDYFIANNSFIESIRSSIPIDQQKYINSGVANLTPIYSAGVTATEKVETYDLSQKDTNHSFLHQDNDAYNDMFEKSRDHSFSVDQTEITEEEGEEDDDITVEEQHKTRVISLMIKLKHLNRSSHTDRNKYNHLSSLLEDIKRDYNVELNHVFKYADAPSTENFELRELYTSIFKSYVEAKLKIDDTKTCSTNVTNKKRKACGTENDCSTSVQQQGKKSRKNYKSDVILILMDWYLKHNGKIPNSKDRQALSKETGKSMAQISTWFQNAKRRYKEKLELYQSLSSKYPKIVYDTRSLRKYLVSNKSS
ncbi:hypothetical protein BD770DRAFT_469493 [Pilaira anomala]|nr:hypothetical protein BD770DRAFT_469493 [Pilaira anomala]